MAENDKVLALEPTASGGVFVGPLETPGPTSATDVLNEDFIDLGSISEDGVTETTDRNIEKKRNWGGKVVKILQTEYSKTYKVTFQESVNGEVLKAIHNIDNVTITAANGSHGNQTAVKHNTKRPQRLSWVLDSIDTELGAKYRTYIPEGQVISTGDVVRVHSDIIQYEVEIEAFEDDNGNHAYDWTDDGQVEDGS